MTKTKYCKCEYPLEAIDINKNKKYCRNCGKYYLVVKIK